MRHIGRCLFCRDGERRFESSIMTTMKDNGTVRQYRMYQIKCSCGAYGVSGTSRSAAIKLWNEETQFKNSDARWHESTEEEG